MRIKKISCFILFMAALLSSVSSYPEEEYGNSSVVIPPGMEVQKVGSVDVIVPKGGRVNKMNEDGSLLIIETPDEYAARKFEDTEARLKRIEGELRAQKEEIERLKKKTEKE